jgi:hypothetical protein
MGCPPPDVDLDNLLYDCLQIGGDLASIGRTRGQTKEIRMAKTATGGLSVERLRELARAGAEVTLKRLRAEIIAIERAFPELALPRRRRAARKAVKQATNRTRRMSAAARKAISERMQRYWAERKKAQAKVRTTKGGA